YLVGAYAHAVVGVNNHQGKVAHAQRAQTFADEIEITRGVDDVDFLAQPLRMQQGRMDGDFSLLFADVVIGDGRAVGNAAHPVDDATTNQHGLGQHGLAGRRVTEDGEVSDVTWSICL